MGESWSSRTSLLHLFKSLAEKMSDQKHVKWNSVLFFFGVRDKIRNALFVILSIDRCDLILPD